MSASGFLSLQEVQALRGIGLEFMYGYVFSVIYMGVIYGLEGLRKNACKVTGL